MSLRNESVFVAKLSTVGRRTGLPRTVEVRLVYLDGRFYASSGNIQSKHWCRNLINSPMAEVFADGVKFHCRVRQVADPKLRQRILSLRDSRPLLDRVVFEMTPHNPSVPDPVAPG